MITQKYLKEILDYSSETGLFIWKITKSSRAVKGNNAGTVQSNGYRCIRIDGKFFRAHRLAWLYVYGEFPKEYIDHIDRDKLNNKISNLRKATNSQNQINTGLNICNKSGHKGVCWHKQRMRWYVSTRVKGKSKHLGSFIKIEDAAKAYNDFMNNTHPEFFKL